MRGLALLSLSYCTSPEKSCTSALRSVGQHRGRAKSTLIHDGTSSSLWHLDWTPGRFFKETLHLKGLGLQRCFKNKHVFDVKRVGG